MSLVINTNVSLSVSDILYDYKSPTIENLLDKLYYSIQLDETKVDKILESFMSKNPLNIGDSLDMSFKTNLDILRSIPITIKVNVVAGNVYLFLNKEVIEIQPDLYERCINNTNSSQVLYTDDNPDYKYFSGECISNKCYILHTRLFYLYKMGIEYKYLKDIVPDEIQQLRYLHIEVPTIYVKTMLEHISGYDDYFTNKFTFKNIWIDEQFLHDLFNKPMNSIKHSHVRDMVWKVRKECKRIRLTNYKQVSMCYSNIRNIIDNEFTDVKLDDLKEDFPILNRMEDFSDVEITRLTIVGLKDKLQFTEIFEYPLLNNIINKLKHEL